MAFQLIDDMLDFISREQTLGKPVGGDLKEGKVTLPLVYALEKASDSERRLVEGVLRDRNYEIVAFADISPWWNGTAASSARASGRSSLPIAPGRLWPNSRKTRISARYLR